MNEQSLMIPVSAVLAVVGFVIGFVFLRNRTARKAAQIRPTEEQVAKLQPQAPEQPVKKAETDSERVTRGMSKTRNFFQQSLDRILSGGQGEKFFEDVEEVMLSSDVGIDFSDKIVAGLKSEFGIKIPARNELKTSLTKTITGLMPSDRAFDLSDATKPHVIMVVGVNGAGKTTTIAKLCARFRGMDKKVIVGAADTYRAAATAQLKTWIERTGAEGVFQPEGSDPSAVAFDTVQAAVSRQSDVCIIDTAGRLHTKTNLMEELKKMKRVVTKAMASAPHEVWLVLDGTQGQNALNQAREFHQALGLTGLIVTKLDGSAKGGAVIAIASELGVPVIFIGVGESPEDLVVFKRSDFVTAIFDGI